MGEKELLNNISMMTSEVEWTYPLDYAATLDICSDNIKAWKSVINAIEREIEITKGADYTERRIGLFKALGIVKDYCSDCKVKV